MRRVGERRQGIHGQARGDAGSRADGQRARANGRPLGRHGEEPGDIGRYHHQEDHLACPQTRKPRASGGRGKFRSLHVGLDQDEREHRGVTDDPHGARQPAVPAGPKTRLAAHGSPASMTTIATTSILLIKVAGSVGAPGQLSQAKPAAATLNASEYPILLGIRGSSLRHNLLRARLTRYRAIGLARRRAKCKSRLPPVPPATGRRSASRRPATGEPGPCDVPQRRPGREGLLPPSHRTNDSGRCPQRRPAWRHRPPSRHRRLVPAAPWRR